MCARFVALCRELGLLMTASVAIDGSKFKAVNTRGKDFTRAKMERRLVQIEESVTRYLSQLDTAGRQEPSEALAVRTAHLKPPAEGRHRNGTARARLQSHAGNEHHRCSTAPGGDEGIVGPRLLFTSSMQTWRAGCGPCWEAKLTKCPTRANAAKLA